MQKCAHIFSFYDLGTKTALKHIVLPSFPHEFIVDAEGRYAYVGIFGIETPNGRDLLLLTNSGEQSISVFDAAQLEEIERIALPANPTALSFHPLRSAAYVSFQDDHVRELDLGSWRFVNAIATLREPDACHVVPRRQLIRARRIARSRCRTRSSTRITTSGASMVRCAIHGFRTRTIRRISFLATTPRYAVISMSTRTAVPQLAHPSSRACMSRPNARARMRSPRPRWLHEVAARAPLPSAVVVWVDLLADDAEQCLAEQAAYPLVRGVRFKPRTSAVPDGALDGPGTLDDPRWPRALERLAAHGLSWDLRVPFWHLGAVAQRLADAPPVDVVLEHAGLPWDRSEAGLAAWRQGMEALAALPRVAVKLSEFGLRDAAWNEAANRRIIADALAIFGAGRCLFASNFPVAGLRVSYPALVNTFAQALDTGCWSAAAQRAVWHDNAIRIYRIDSR